MTRSKPSAPPMESELRVTLDVLRQESDAARPRLRQLLAAGQDTTALRTEIAALERRMEDITVMIAARGAERERKEAAGTAALVRARRQKTAGRAVPGAGSDTDRQSNAGDPAASGLERVAEPRPQGN
jgi:hypothetical protein